MKISQVYLNKWVSNLPKTDDLSDNLSDKLSYKLSEQLTEQGLEVDEVISLGSGLKNIEIGHVLEKEQHPDADRLSVCTVLVSDDQRLNIVCGAKNIDKNQKVPVARIGAVLPGNFKIKKSKLRGVLSEGMICSETELGLSDTSAGIMVLPEDAPIGEDVLKYLELDDHIIDIELTANRGDCANYIGVAREAAVINKTSYKIPDYLENYINIGKKLLSNNSKTHTLHHDARNLCPAYCLYKINLAGANSGFNNKLFIDLGEFLRRSGVSSVNTIVDIINSVMLNFGQPMHAFDADEINGVISVRMAKKGEKIEALNDKTYDLSPDALIIADESGPLAIAGIIGGKRGSVSNNTKNILLEAAYFDKISIAKTARSYGLQTDASYRFERGIDPQQLEKSAMAVIGNLKDYFPDLSIDYKYESSLSDIFLSKEVKFDLAKSCSYLGIKSLEDIGSSVISIQDGFKVLGFDLKNSAQNNWVLSIPSWRHDVSEEVDLIEEMARIIGYNNIPSSLPVLDSSVNILQKSKQLQKAKDYYQNSFLETAFGCLLGRGYSEALNYSFVSKERLELFGFDHKSLLEITNPLSKELEVMTPSLLPGLLKNCQYNIKRQQTSVRLFEQGRCFLKHKNSDNTNTPANEFEVFSGLICGDAMDLNIHEQRKCDFYDIKSDIMALLSAYKDDISIDINELPSYFHPGQSMRILFKNDLIGHCGAIHPKISNSLGLPGSVYVFEINFMLLPNFKSDTNNKIIKNISKYPQVSRDIAFIINSDILVGDIIGALVLSESKSESKSNILKDIKCFDIFTDKDKLGENKKSVALRLTLQDNDQTLSEESINNIVSKLLDILKKKFAAILRD